MDSDIDDPFPEGFFESFREVITAGTSDFVSEIPAFLTSQDLFYRLLNVAFLTQMFDNLAYNFFVVSDILYSPALYFTFTGIILVVLLFLSAIISGSEVAYFSLSSTDLSTLKENTGASEKRVIQLLEKPRELLATILIMNNLVNVAIVTLSTFLSWEIVGSQSSKGQVVVVLTFIVTFILVFFGEVVPKVYATQNNFQFAKKMATFLEISRTVVRPLSYLLMSISNIIEKRVSKRGYDISMDQLNHALQLTTPDHMDEGNDILKGIVNFSTLSVRQVMKSRLDITAIDIELDYHELMDRINKSGYSRIPVYKETIDKIEGILYIKDLLPYLEKDETFQWQKLLRAGFFIPESKKIDSLLRDFQDKRVHLAIVVDEYGGTSGLITLEDIIEEIVGEINDEFDEDDIAYNKLDNNTYIFEGKTSLNDFCKIINVDANIFEEIKGDSESLGGLLLEINSKLPRVGEKIKFDRFVFTIVSVDARRIKRVRVFLKPSEKDNND